MNAPNLSALLNKTSEDAPRPVPLPDGTFYGVISAQAFVESSVKKTTGCQYTVKITHPHPDVDMSEYEAEGGTLDDKTIANNGTTFWLSEKALFMFFDFVASLGITTEGRSIKELAPQPVGQAVMLDIVKRPNNSGTGFFNEVRRMSAAQ